MLNINDKLNRELDIFNVSSLTPNLTIALEIELEDTFRYSYYFSKLTNTNWLLRNKFVDYNVINILVYTNLRYSHYDYTK